MRQCSPLLLVIVAWSALASGLRANEPDAKVSEAKKGDDGILVHTVESPHLDRTTMIRVLLPTKLEKGKRYRVLFVLPVEAGDGSRYGDGLAEVKKLGLHDKHGLVCVQPTFARLPWYADHPTDKKIAQESHLLKVVLPFVEKTYPVQPKAEGRLLLGFSKSGWGVLLAAASPRPLRQGGGQRVQHLLVDGRLLRLAVGPGREGAFARPGKWRPGREAASPGRANAPLFYPGEQRAVVFSTCIRRPPTTAKTPLVRSPDARPGQNGRNPCRTRSPARCSRHA